MSTTRLGIEPHQLREFAEGLLELGATDVIIALLALIIAHVATSKVRCCVTSISETSRRMSAWIRQTEFVHVAATVPANALVFAATK